MEYPVWYLTALGGGFWIALVATVHVFVAQFAVGGGLFLVLSEHLAYRTGSAELLEYVKKHSKFFLLLTMVFGGVTGVAIWFIIAVLSPHGTLTLIRQFVFGWASEWVCFLGEIAALLVYFYSWKKMDRSDHLKIGWLYFIFAWLSLFLINGIIGFMLTPGEWISTHDFWDGFFNPTFWPQLFFRSFICVMLAELFGFVTSTWIKDDVVRCKMVRLCSVWTLAGFLLMLPCAWWYIAALPQEQAELMLLKSHRINYFMKMFRYFAPVVFAGGLVMAVCMPRKVKLPLALILLFLALGLTGSFEFIREAGRKPYIIWDYMYSNSIPVEGSEKMLGRSFLARTKWVPDGLRKIDDSNRAEAGKWLFQLQCSSCHSIGGPLNDIRPRTVKYSVAGMDAFLSGMGKLNRYMPPFFGNSAERRALAEYISKDVDGGAAKPAPETSIADVAPSDFKSEEYVLLAWPLQGLRVLADAGGHGYISTPGNLVRAQLVMRGDSPQVVTEDVKLTCKVRGTDELFQFMAVDGYFESSAIPVTPYSAKGYDPLPVIDVQANDSSGNLIASTSIVLPVSTRLSCNNCHGGGWHVSGQGGISTATADDMLKVHDRDNRTDLLRRVGEGQSIDCVSCHNGDSRLEISAALHGFHAVYLGGLENEACMMCHPAESLRGRHADAGMECVNCHGVMEDHALALLRAEPENPASVRLMKLLMPVRYNSVEEINPRKAWEQEPDCLTCHANFGPPETDSAFNVWNEEKSGLFSNRKGEMGAIMCAACHNAPHAIFPAQDERDNLRALQFMGKAQTFGKDGSCTVCHTVPQDMAAHHAGMGLD